MAALTWDNNGERLYETGVNQVALFVTDSAGAYPKGVAWNGVTAVNENPEGAESSDLYADNEVYLSLTSAEKMKASLSAYTYPDEFGVCDGSVEPVAGVSIGMQSRRVFGLAYITKHGNDLDGNDAGEKLHILWGLKAAPSSREYATINDSPEAIEFSWEMTSTPVSVSGFKKTSILTFDSLKCNATKYEALKAVVYGDATHEARLPLPDECLSLMGYTAP